MLTLWKQKFLEFHKKHETRLEVLFFVVGFIFDALLASDVDEPFSLIQQALYLLLIGVLLHYEVLYRLLKWRPSEWLYKYWDYRNLLLHFLLGTLLNIYSLFYIKSSSFMSSVVFLLLMIGIILANELPVVKKSKVSLKVGLFAICLLSYISILYPLLLGFIGWTPFGLSIATTLGFLYIQIKWLDRTLQNQKILFDALFVPAVSVVIIFSLFYWMGWIPPVPLSAKEQGIYHLIEKKEGAYLLSTEKTWWKFWQSGDQDFLAEPGDKIYFYVQIYSPARISGEVYIHWFFKDAKNNWQASDRIPLKIVGGREEGYRGYAVKSNYQPGDWRVKVETATGQEISRLSLTVTPAAVNPNRSFEILRY